MKYGIQKISLKGLMRRDWLDTEMRLKINNDKVMQYAQEKAEGDVFPDPVVFADPKTQLFHVGDGFHRLLAEAANGAKTAQVNLCRGSPLDAILWNIEANRKQLGLPFTTGDKSKAVAVLLQHLDTCNWTMTRIAETVGCACSTVTNVKNKLDIERPEVLIDKNGRKIIRQNVSKDREVVTERRAHVAKLYLAGETQEEIAAKLDISRSTIQRDIMEMSREHDIIKCPHCHGTGRISNLDTSG